MGFSSRAGMICGLISSLTCHLWQVTESANAAEGLRDAEKQAISRKLAQDGLVLTEVGSDGHCLFRAIEHQLKLLRGPQGPGFTELRRVAADFLRQNWERFAPFFVNANGDPANREEFFAHCQDIEKAAWGDSLELQALSEALRARIIVISAEAEDVVFGERWAESGVTMCLSFHRRLHTLGAHYNSVHPPLSSIQGSTY
eukprot:RCo009858